MHIGRAYNLSKIQDKTHPKTVLGSVGDLTVGLQIMTESVSSSHVVLASIPAL